MCKFELFHTLHVYWTLKCLLRFTNHIGDHHSDQEGCTDDIKRIVVGHDQAFPSCHCIDSSQSLFLREYRVGSVSAEIAFQSIEACDGGRII